jgi:hypothetical protein
MENIMEFEFSGKIILDDYINYNKFVYKKFEKYVGIGLLFIIVFLYSINKIIKYFLNIKLNNNYINNVNGLSEKNNIEIENLINVSSNTNIMFEVILPIVLFILLVSVLYFLFKLIVGKILYKKICAKYYYTNKMLGEYSNYKIKNDNIIITSDSGTVIITKEKILKIFYEQYSIYIFIGLNAAYIIKRHFFQNDKDYDELVNFMKENYKGN